MPPEEPAGRAREVRRRRDRRGRGLRGPLVPPHVPLARTPAQEFDEMVLDAVEQVEELWGEQLTALEFAVEDVPPADAAVDAVPLSRLMPAGTEGGRPHPTRVVLYRRPLEARATSGGDLAALVYEVVLHEVAQHLGVDPDAIDPDDEPGE